MGLNSLSGAASRLAARARNRTLRSIAAALWRVRPAPLAARLGDMDVRPVREQLLDEVAAGECMTVLRPARDEQHRLAEDRLIPGLLDRLVAGDPEHPAVPGG